jgi:hypothetical protein
MRVEAKVDVRHWFGVDDVACAHIPFQEAQRVVVPPVDPLNLRDASDAPPTKEELKEMLKAGGGVSSWQATAVTEWSER